MISRLKGKVFLPKPKGLGHLKLKTTGKIEKLLVATGKTVARFIRNLNRKDSFW